MKQKVLPLVEGVDFIRNKIEKKLAKKTEILVVLVAGGTASGKTSAVAKKIKDTFSDSQILSMDNYYRGKEYYKKHNLNFDQPEALDLDLFFEHLKTLKKGKSVKIPEYDFKKGYPEYDKIHIKPTKVIIVEGLFALHKDIEKLGDIKIFVDLGVHSQILRRLFRDVDRTGDSPKNILKYFLDVVYKMHKKYIAPTKKYADIILQNEYTPEVEAKNAKGKDDRIKYKLSTANAKEKLGELIYKLGGSYVGKTEQTDYFFNPTGNYEETGEIMVIRKLAFQRYFFMYFGPDDHTTFYDDRYTLRFFTDYQTLEAFKELYPVKSFELTKRRRSFYIEGVLVCLDEFENGDTYLVFKFDGDLRRDIILEILEHLQIDANKGIKKSYIQIYNT